jgi:hypothetical protein
MMPWEKDIDHPNKWKKGANNEVWNIPMITIENKVAIK